MPELTDSVPKPDVDILPPKHLPTTLEIAKEGAQAYRNFMFHPKLQRGMGRQIAKTIDQGGIPGMLFSFPNCFVGIEPHVSFDRSPFAGERDPIIERILIPVLETTAPNLAIVVHSLNQYGHPDKISIVNLKAIAHVATLYPQYFPDEARQDTRVWVTSWLNTDRNSKPTHTVPDQDSRFDEIRMGLLSGYPLDAVVKFAHYGTAIEKIGKFMPNQLRDIIEIIKLPDDHHKWSFPALQELVDRLADVLTADEKGALLTAHKFGSPLRGGVGFNRESDKQYLQRMIDLITESGLVEVIDDFRRLRRKKYIEGQKSPKELLSHSLWLVQRGRWRLIPNYIKETLSQKAD